jgi:nicotinic acid mononucleotide adenylyltransferase
LSNSETAQLNNIINSHHWIFTDKHGKNHPQANDLTLKSEPGSYRLSWYNTDFAEALYNRLKSHLDILLLSEDEVNHNADYENCKVWRPVGINPYMRFIKYTNNDTLVPHYDSPYTYNSSTKTLKSVVIYLTTTSSGSTCFIKEKPDAQGYQDWQNNTSPEDIITQINCVSGSALVFNHRMLHSAAPVVNEEKIIIRTDVIYEKCYPTTTITYSTEPLGLVSSKQTTYSDTYYASASQFYTHEELLQAGYLPSVPKSLPIHFNYMGTPYHKLQINTKKPSIILLSTGCFNPIHIGHIKMLEHAKHYVENNMGAEVIGGYFSIAHAAYQTYKQQKPINIVNVTNACDTALNDYDWLMVDPYAALYESTDLNFTTIIDRLEKYIKYQNINAQIVYVFGGDNAAFARAFRAKGTAICINRPGCESTFNKVRAEFATLNTNVHFVDMYTENISSTMIRNAKIQPTPKSRPTGNYIINEDSYCESNPILPKDSLITFNANIVKLFEKYTNQEQNKIILNKCQLDVATAQTPHIPPEISLNPYYITDYNLCVSTLYAAAAYKTRLNLVARPGVYKTIQQQLEAIPSGTYTLVDDDTYSGYTMKKIQEILQNTHVKTANIKFTNTHVAQDNIFDIVDCRDLHIGRENGGAVIRLPNKTICRAPYILPYCFPSAKCSISTEYDLQFSLDVWKLNHAYYRPTTITLRDVDQNTQLLFLASGFVLDHPMSYICKCHIMYLEH